jgi:AhpD family alkylhydroperoxidase
LRPAARTAAAVLAVSVWTPLANAGIAHRWFTWPNIGFLSPVPVVTALIGVSEWYALTHRHELTPFLGAVGLFLMSFIGLAISLWPMIVPYQYTLWQAASSESTQAFPVIGTLFLLPIILMYTAWSYWIFRGRRAPTSATIEWGERDRAGGRGADPGACLRVPPRRREMGHPEKPEGEMAEIYPASTREYAARRRELAPEQQAAFDAFSKAVFADGALPGKTKQIIAVAVAHVTQCPYCIQGHTAAALRAGATPSELMEAVWVAAEMRAGASYAHSALMLARLAEQQPSRGS